MKKETFIYPDFGYRHLYLNFNHFELLEVIFGQFPNAQQIDAISIMLHRYSDIDLKPNHPFISYLQRKRKNLFDLLTIQQNKQQKLF